MFLSRYNTGKLLKQKAQKIFRKIFRVCNTTFRLLDFSQKKLKIALIPEVS